MMDADWKFPVLACCIVLLQHAEAETTAPTKPTTEAPEPNDPRDMKRAYIIIGVAVVGVSILTTVAICVSFWVWQNRRRAAKRVLRTRYVVSAPKKSEEQPPIEHMFLASSATGEPGDAVVNLPNRTDDELDTLSNMANDIDGTVTLDARPPWATHMEKGIGGVAAIDGRAQRGRDSENGTCGIPALDARLQRAKDREEGICGIAAMDERPPSRAADGIDSPGIDSPGIDGRPPIGRDRTGARSPFGKELKSSLSRKTQGRDTPNFMRVGEAHIEEENKSNIDKEVDTANGVGRFKVNVPNGDRDTIHVSTESDIEFDGYAGYSGSA